MEKKKENVRRKNPVLQQYLIPRIVRLLPSVQRSLRGIEGKSLRENAVTVLRERKVQSLRESEAIVLRENAAAVLRVIVQREFRMEKRTFGHRRND